MFYALRDGAKISPTPRSRAVCPLCARAVIAKCGEHVEWHWAHEIGSECDSWHEPETPWHLWWKQRAPLVWREASMGPHRADIRRDDGNVIELQHSAISSEEIREREAFYERMIWVIDGRAYNFNFSEFGVAVPRLEHEGDGWWRWRRPRSSFTAAKKRVCIDLGEQILEVLRFNEIRTGFYIHARTRPRNEFLRKIELTPPTTEENEITSYIVEWRVPFVPRDIQTLKERSKRREFGDAESLRSWYGRRRSSEELVRVLAWYRNGRVIADEDLFRELCNLPR